MSTEGQSAKPDADKAEEAVTKTDKKETRTPSGTTIEETTKKVT